MSIVVFSWTVGLLLAAAIVPAVAWLIVDRGRWLLLASAVGCGGLAVLVAVDSQPGWVAIPFVVCAAVLAWVWRDEDEREPA